MESNHHYQVRSLEYYPLYYAGNCLVLLTGFEPATYDLSNRNVYQLRHRSILVETRGFEPRSRPYEWKFCKLLTASLSGWPLFTCATITPGLRKTFCYAVDFVSLLFYNLTTL